MRKVLNATTVFLALCLSAGVPVAQQPTQAQRDAIRNSCRSDFMSNCSGVTPGGLEALQCLQRNSARLSVGCRNSVNAISPPLAQPAATPVPRRLQYLFPRQRPPLLDLPPGVPERQPRRRRRLRDDPPTSSGRRSVRPARPTSSRAARRPARRHAGITMPAGHAPELSSVCGQALAAILPAAAAPSAAAPDPQPHHRSPLNLQRLSSRSRRCRCGSGSKFSISAGQSSISLCVSIPLGGGRLIDCLVTNQASISPGCRRALLWAGSAARGF